MNDREVNTLMMLKGVRDFLQDNAGTVAKVPALEILSRELAEKITAIDQTALQHATVAAGKTDVKLTARDTLLDMANVTSSALYAFARRRGLLETLALSRLPDHRVRDLRDEELIRYAEVIHGALLSAGPELSAYGVGEAGVQELRAAIDAFAKALGTRDHSRSARTVSRSTLSALFADARTLLIEEVDAVMELYRVSDPAFYDMYRALRVTKSLAVRYRKENGGAPGTGSPVLDASLSAEPNPAIGSPTPSGISMVPVPTATSPAAAGSVRPPTPEPIPAGVAVQ